MIGRVVRTMRGVWRRWWQAKVERDLAKDAAERAERAAMVRRVEAEVTALHRGLRRVR